MNIIICRAREVIDQIAEHNVSAVLSIEHPGAQDGKGRAPRLHNIAQSILCFWDIEKEDIPDGPHLSHIKDAFAFLDQHSDENVIIHCNAGKARSVGIALAYLVSDLGDINAAIERIKAIRPIAAPNLALIKIADRFLELDGALTKAVLADPLFTQNRERAEKARQRQIDNQEFDNAPEKKGPEIK